MQQELKEKLRQEEADKAALAKEKAEAKYADDQELHVMDPTASSMMSTYPSSNCDGEGEKLIEGKPKTPLAENEDPNGEQEGKEKKAKKRELPRLSAIIPSPLKGTSEDKDKVKSPHGTTSERRGSLENVAEATADIVEAEPKDKPRRVLSRSKSLSKIIMPGKSSADSKPLLFEKVDPTTPLSPTSTSPSSTSSASSTNPTSEKDKPVSAKEEGGAKEGKDDWNVLQKVKSGKKLFMSKIIEEKKGDQTQTKVEKMMDSMEKDRLKDKVRERDAAKEKEKKLRERRELSEKEAHELGAPPTKGVVLNFKNSHQASVVKIDPNPTTLPTTVTNNSPNSVLEVSYTNTTTVGAVVNEKESNSADGSHDETEGGIPHSLLLHRESYELLTQQLHLIETETTPTAPNEKAVGDAKPMEEIKSAPEKLRTSAVHVQPKRTALRSSATSLSTSPPSPTSQPIVEKDESSSEQSPRKQAEGGNEKAEGTTAEGLAPSSSSASRPGSPGIFLY
jgi:hypothetical protein